MTSKTTKSIASRISLDLYSQLKNEADILDLNMKDYLLKIIMERNKKEDPLITGKEKTTTQKKQPKEKINKIDIIGSVIEFPE